MATQPNWWESAPLVSPANDPGFTGYIPGTPKPPKPDEPPSGYRWTAGPGSGLEPIPGGPADKTTDPKAQESERTAAYLATNLTANVSLMNQALKVDPSAAKPTWGQWFAGIFGDTAENIASPEQRQVVINSQKLITDAALTLGTGAAYTKEQIDAYRRGFFPQIGDSEAAVKAKHEALRAALVAARLKAGNQAPQIDAAMQQLGMDPTAPLTMSLDDALKTAGPGNKGSGEGGDGKTPPGVGELNDDQKKAYAAFVASHNGKPDPASLKTFLEGLTSKTVTNADAIAKALAKGSAINPSTVDLTYQQKVEQKIAEEDKLGIKDDAATTLARQGGTLSLSDEAAGAGNALANVILSPLPSIDFHPGESYAIGRDAERQRIEDARQQLGYGGTAIELASGMASLGPSGALATMAPKEAAQAAGKAGAAGGALAGYGSGEGAQDSTTRAGVGALGGYALGRYAPAVVDRVLPRRLRAPQGMAPDVAQAAEAEGVDLIRPMVDPASISDYGALESNVYSQPIIRGAAGRVRGQIEDRTLALGGSGTPLDPEAAGGKVQDAARRYIQRSKGVATRLYARARDLSKDYAIIPEHAIEQADTELAQLMENPETNAAEIKFIERVRSDLSQSGGKKVDSLRALRTSLRGAVNEANLTSTQAEARVHRILDAAHEDLGMLPDAARSAFRRADSFYRERMVHVDDVLRRFLGPKDSPVSGEAAFSRLKSVASPGGDGRRLAALMRDLEPSERQDIAATIAQGLGRRAPDEPFSTALFLSQARKLSPSARRTIFGPDGAQSIDNLRLLSRKLEEAEKDINRSRSATVLERQGLRQAARAFIAGLAGMGGTAATGSLSGGIAGAAVAAGAMGASAFRRVLSARAMVNPRVSRWLAESADVSTPPQAKEAARKLGVIIAREPALAQELKHVYDFLENRLELPLAAQPDQGTEGNNE